jgi:plastocyanin
MSHVLKKVSLGMFAIAMAFAGYFAAAPSVSALTSIGEISAGDLIRGETFSAVYYMGEDGMRYVFPNQKTYDTWYSDFDDVRFISDTDLATIQIGGNVTYRPGVMMIKITSDPNVYAVSERGTLRHVDGEDVATALYGSSWNTMIHDIPDGFFTNYSIGEAISDASDYDAHLETSLATTIDADKGLLPPAEIDVSGSGFSPIDVTISAGQGVRFTNTGSEKHNATGDDLTWGTGTLSAGSVWIVTFEEEGVYTFYDGYDSSNTGAVFVD